MTNFRLRSSRGASFRKSILAAAVVGAVALTGLGGYMVYRNNSPTQLAQRAQLALDQRDPARAVEYLQKALSRNPQGEIGNGLRLLMARALLEQEREIDARDYLQQIPEGTPQNFDALDLVARSYVNPAYATLRKKPKPLSPADAQAIKTIIQDNLAVFEKDLPGTARNLVARAELHRLRFLIDSDQSRQASARRDAATVSTDAAAAADAAAQVQSIAATMEQDQQKSIDLLEEAVRLEPTHTGASSLLAQYLYQDHRYARSVQLYQQLKARDAATLPEEVVLNAARSVQEDVRANPDRAKRNAEALEMLDEYLKLHPKSVRAMVAMGDVLLEENRVADAVKMGERAVAEAPNELFAQVLLVNCRIESGEPQEALKLLSALTTSHDNRPEVWYLQGLASKDAGDAAGAENAFRKALAVSPGFTQAREALLKLEIQKGSTEAAAATAAQVLRENRYNFEAWQVTIDALRRRGQPDRARQLLVSFANETSAATAGGAELPPDRRTELARFLARNGLPQEAQALLGAPDDRDSASLALRAVIADSRGDDAQARALMGRAVAADPAKIEYRLHLADLLLRAGLTADVRTQLDAIVTNQKTLSVDERIAVAERYLRVRLPARALELLKADSPASGRVAELARNAQAMLAGESAPPQPAVAPADMTPADALRLGTAALNEKKYDQALTFARQALQQEKTQHQAALHQLAARALAALNQPAEALDHAVAAATAEPNRAEPYRTYISLFPGENAARGISHGGRFTAINPAFGNWAMGQLAEASGQADLALTFYNSGVEAAIRIVDPRPAREQLYQAILALYARRNDAAAIRRVADAFSAADSASAPGVRLLATERLLAMGDRAAATQQLDALTATIDKDSLPRLVLAVASAWLTLEKPDKALALMEKQVAGAPTQPDLLDAYATLLGQMRTVDPANLDKALDLRKKLAALVPGEPRFRVSLADLHAAAGDYPAAFAALDQAAALGDTGAQLASAARIRQLISLGLLHDAADLLQSRSSREDDFASMLAVAQAWAQLDKHDDARKMAAAIPAYAAEFPHARVLLAALDTDKGDFASAVASLTQVAATSGEYAAIVAPQLFLAHVRAGDAQAALDLALRQKALWPDNTPQSRYWTTLAATAAREGKKYPDAIALLAALDPESRKSAALDIALMNLLQGKPVDSADLADNGPAFNASTFTLLAGKPTPSDRLLSAGLPSAVLAVLATTPAPQHASALQQLAQNPRIIPADIQTLLASLGNDPAPKLRTIALAQRLLEAGWSTTALDLLNDLDKATPNIAFVAVQRHQAMTDLRRTQEANSLRDAWAARANDPSFPPSMRILLAASWSREGQHDKALAILQPLAPLNRPEILTTLASLHEKLNQLDQAVALHRQVRKLDPENLSAANNLAYTLAAARPADKAALSEALESIQFAIARAPRITAFQDTLGWIQILSGNAPEGTRRIAQAAPSLRLDPAVHYHLGMGYARLGNKDLARRHLLNVGHLTRDRSNIPETKLATDALTSLASTH